MIGRALYPIQSSRPGPTGAEQMHNVLQACSDDAVIRVYDDTRNVIETHEHKGDFKER